MFYTHKLQQVLLRLINYAGEDCTKVFHIQTREMVARPYDGSHYVRMYSICVSTNMLVIIKHKCACEERRKIFYDL